MANDYDPSLEDFCDILKDYSLTGLKYFRELGGQPRIDLLKMFNGGNLIESASEALEHKFSEAKKRRDPHFNLIPMPRPHGRDFLISFFAPRFDFSPKDKEFDCSFYLVLWISHDGGGRSIAFRLEPADRAAGPHSYPHLQICRTIKKPRFNSSLEWAPDSSPAFPIRLQTPLHFFAATAVAVHGFAPTKNADYVAGVIQAAMQEGAAADRARKVIGEIRRVFAD
jgi:hypothetical protein